MPVRVWLERKPGWRKPPNTRVVTRTSRFGNPFKILLPSRHGTQDWQVVWTRSKGAGFGREPPADFEPALCETEHQAYELAVRLFREWLTAPEQANLLEAFQHELVGFNLACSCRLDLSCHADVLLDLVNRP
jgi:hypothetical protein